MRNVIQSKKIAYIIFTITFLLVLILIFYKKKDAYDLLVLGDSNIGNFRDDTAVTSIIASKLNTKVFNGGFGGTAAALDSANKEAFIADASSFASIADAIYNDDFSRILSIAPIKDDGDLLYFDESLRNLAKIDFNKVKVLLIAYGTNDALNGYSVEEYKNYLFSGVSKIHEKYPDIKIILVTPFYNDKTADKISEYGNALLEEMVLTDNITDWKNDITVFDAYNAGIVSKENINEATIDGVHLNENARKIYGEKLAEIVANYL